MTQSNELDVDSLFETGVRLNQVGQFSEAIAYYEKALELNPQRHDIWNDLGVTQDLLGEYPMAIVSYDRVLEVEPDFYNAWYNRGNSLANLCNHGEAVVNYDKALEIKPDYYEAWNNRAIALGKLGRYQEVVESYDQALAIRPAYYEAWYNRAIALEELGQLEEAIASYDRALASRPGYAQAWYNRAIILEKLNRFEEAIATYSRAVAVQPEFPEAWNNLGIVLERLDRYEEAISSYDRAIALKPDLQLSWYNLGNVLRVLGRYPNAINCYEQAIALQPDYAEAYCNLGVILETQFRTDEAVEYYKKALAIKPDFPEVQRNLRVLSFKLIPRWHFAMINDINRNESYDKALRKIITSDSIVLDIGSGSGLLAMMAARAGAKSVTTCEVVKPIAEVAQQIVELNDLSENVTVVNKKSYNLTVGADMSAKANVLVAEIFDVGLLGEEAIAIIKHARNNLLTEDAQILPKSAQVYGVVLESQKLWEEDMVKTAAGFDVTPFNAFSTTPNYLQKQLQFYPHRYLSDVFEVFSFNFYDDILPQTHEIDVSITSDGQFQAIAFWFRLWLDHEIFIDSSPQSLGTHWMQAVQLVGTSSVVTGQSLKLLAKHDCATISFEVKHDDK